MLGVWSAHGVLGVVRVVQMEVGRSGTGEKNPQFGDVDERYEENNL